MKKSATQTSVPLEPRQPADPADSLQQQQQTALLHQALMKLPPEKREVLVLSRFQDLDHREISQLLGCEVGAVKVRIFRALRELREILHQLEEPSVSVQVKP